MVQYTVHVWHGHTDATSYMTIKNFPTLGEALKYFSHGRRRRAMVIDLTDNRVVARKGEWF